MSDETPKPEELVKIDFEPPKEGWMDKKVDFSKKGTWCYSGTSKSLEYLGLPNPREWQPSDEDWQLPDNWKKLIFEGFKERLDKYRSFRLFMDICVRCGACADKCHYFIGSGDPKNMPVLRAELLRSVYRNDFTLFGKILGKFAGARELTIDVIKEWFYYFFQCTECRRCSVFCPYGIDTAEITMQARELMNLVGLNINWITEPAANCFRTGNHLGIEPHAFADNINFAVDDLEELTGVRVDASINRKGAEILVVPPSADYFADPHYYTFLGYLALFQKTGSESDSEGGAVCFGQC